MESHLHPIADFLDPAGLPEGATITDWYEGRCPQTGTWNQLPRTVLAESTARRLMQCLSTNPQFEREGKMYGVLLVATESGEMGVLKAFSGLLNGQTHQPGWVPPIPGRDQLALAEAETLSCLDAIKQELIQLQQLPQRQQYQALVQQFAADWQALKQRHQQRKQERHQQRQQASQQLSGAALSQALNLLDAQSQQDGIEQRRFKQQRDQVLKSLQQTIEQADACIQQLKQQRKRLSQTLQQQLHAAYRLTNFSGDSVALDDLRLSSAFPTGTGDCCAPKLLHYAATHGLQPLAMAEFWWGSDTADKQAGAFYGACAERCQPLMGFLLSGLPLRLAAGAAPADTVQILYQDDWLIIVNKPAGLLSVPGRYGDRQDSVLLQLRQQFGPIWAVHRLDQDTSGILLLARNLSTYRPLSQQFQQGRVRKLYEAVLAGSVAVPSGLIELPLWADPTDRPRQKVDWQLGKPSVTRFRVLGTEDHFTRVEFQPLTGRTHQLRLHAADPQGLGVPILGDRLYGKAGERLHLHAKYLQFVHPQSQQSVMIESPVPF